MTRELDEDRQHRGTATVGERLAIAFLTAFLCCVVVFFSLLTLNTIPGVKVFVRAWDWSRIIGVSTTVSFVVGLWFPHATIEWLGNAWKKIFSHTCPNCGMRGVSMLAKFLSNPIYPARCSFCPDRCDKCDRVVWVQIAVMLLYFAVRPHVSTLGALPDWLYLAAIALVGQVGPLCPAVGASD